MLYADNTTIYLSDPNTLSLKECLSQDLVALSTWIANNGLTMNTQKTQFMVLSKRGRDKEVEKLQIKVNGEVLRKCDEEKWIANSVGRIMWKLLEGSALEVSPNCTRSRMLSQEAEGAPVPITDPSTLRLLRLRMG